MSAPAAHIDNPRDAPAAPVSFPHLDPAARSTFGDSSVSTQEKQQEQPSNDNEADEGAQELDEPENRILPIISGLVCPFSVLLDIPGLTSRWYIRTEGNNIVETQPNPALLDAGQAVALALGVLANAALIWRFLEHRPRICTWVAMLSLALRDATSIAIVTWFGVVHRFSDGFVYGDAFWLSVAATVASTVCNVTLVLDLIRTKDFDKKGSGLTEKQRMLVIVSMVFFLNLGVGSLCYSYLIDGLRFIDALYFTECILTSVGFGDILPHSVGSRIFTLFYAPIGIINLAVLIAIARETIIESFEASYRARRDRLAQKARERKEAIRRKQEMARERRRRAAEEGAQAGGADDSADAGREKGTAPAFVPPPSRSALVAGLGAAVPVAGALGGGQKAAPASGGVLAALEQVESGGSAGRRARVRAAAPVRWARRLLAACSPRRRRAAHDCEAARPLDDDREVGAPLRRTTSASSTMTTTSIDQSFATLKEQLAQEQRQEFRVKLGVALLVFLVFWLAGSAIYSVTEDGWSMWTGMWFSFVYFTTLGLGDYTPKSVAGRAFFVAWSILGIASMTLLLSVITESWSARYKSSITDGRFKKALRRVRATSSGSGDDAPTSREVSERLFARDGYAPLSGEGDGPPATAEELPEKIVQALKGFHAHAKYFMAPAALTPLPRPQLGRTGQPPSQLRALLAAAEVADDGLDHLLERGGASLVEAGAAQGDTAQFLFLVSYERQFDLLLESAEQLAAVLGASAAETSRLEADNARLREELAAAQDALHIATAEEPGGSFFRGRPAGGLGDAAVEEELCEEIDCRRDGAVTADGANAPHPAPPHLRIPLPHPHLPHSHPDTSTMAHLAPLTPVSSSPGPFRTRTPSLSFAPPPIIQREQAEPHISDGDEP
ncbi:Potassium channel [Rhodotorula kratochvilovae]